MNLEGRLQATSEAIGAIGQPLPLESASAKLPSQPPSAYVNAQLPRNVDVAAVQSVEISDSRQ